MSSENVFGEVQTSERPPLGGIGGRNSCTMKLGGGIIARVAVQCGRRSPSGYLMDAGDWEEFPAASDFLYSLVCFIVHHIIAHDRYASCACRGDY